MKKILIFLLAFAMLLLAACGKPAEETTEVTETAETVETAETAEPAKFETAKTFIGKDIAELLTAIGQPRDSMYADSCLGEGDDGELYYDGFTVYTYRPSAEQETVYDVMENME